MKIKTMYTCEVCGTNYEDKNKAKGCEKTHKVGLEIEREPTTYRIIAVIMTLRAFLCGYG